MDTPLDAKPIPVALQRLIDEVRDNKLPDGGKYNRTYHRHNRS